MPARADQQAGQLVLFDPGRIGLGRLAPVVDRLDDLAASGELTVGEAVAYVVDRTEAVQRLAGSSVAIFLPIWRGFARFASRACGVDLLDDVDRAVVVRFLETTTRTGGPPSDATRHLRRSALRFLFASLREAGLMLADPTCDVRLPSRSPRTFRPLTTTEVERCRAASQATLLSTREPAVWALAEVGATGVEIGEMARLAILGGRVLLSGGVKTDVRVVSLTRWGQGAIRRRLVEVEGRRWLVSADTAASQHSRRSAALEALRRTMRRAGVAGPDVEPRSVTAWAGQQILARTGRVEDVALGLGLRRLDQAAELIAYDWRSV